MDTLTLDSAEQKALRTATRDRCVLCGSSGDVLHADVPDYYFQVPGRWTLRQCSDDRCRLIWQDPMVVSEDLVKAYATYYTTGASRTDDKSQARRGSSRSFFYFLDRLLTRFLGLGPERARHAVAYLDDCRGGKLLDVGCGSGAFAASMQKNGWAVRGTEFDPSAAAHAARLHDIPVDVGELRDLRYEDESFDAVTARHVVEHVRDPLAFLVECMRILKPGGRLVFITPNLGSCGHGHFGQRWRGLEQPRHLFLFDAVSMRALFGRAGVNAFCVFATAQGTSYVLRASFETGKGFVRRCVDYASIWWLQMYETVLTRRGRPVGEELVAIACKPVIDSRERIVS